MMNDWFISEVHYPMVWEVASATLAGEWQFFLQQQRRRGGQRRREAADDAAEGVFVVVVADNECGTPSYPGSRFALHAKALGEAKYGRERRRHVRNITPSRSLLPIGEGKMAVLAALAAVTLAVECQEVTSDQ